MFFENVKMHNIFFDGKVYV